MTKPKLMYWDLDAKGHPYYAGKSRDAMMLTATRMERGDYQLYRGEKDKRWVSTVFLWINHRWDEGPPLVFETAAYCGGKVIVCERYSTRRQAQAGHRKWCRTYLES